MSTDQKVSSPVARKRVVRGGGSRRPAASADAPDAVTFKYEKLPVPDLTLGAAFEPFSVGVGRNPLRIQMVSVQEQTLADRAVRLTSMSKAITGQLARTGLPANVIELLRQLTRIELESARLAMTDAAQAVGHELREESHRDAGADTAYALLTASKMARALNVSDETVRNYEKDNKLFSFLGPARRRGRSYPAFQAMKHIVGAPLVRVLGTLEGLDGASIYQFFSSPSIDLAGLTPVEVMTGRLTLARVLDNDGLQILKAQDKDRLSKAVGSAKVFLADAAA